MDGRVWTCGYVRVDVCVWMHGLTGRRGLGLQTWRYATTRPLRQTDSTPTPEFPFQGGKRVQGCGAEPRRLGGAPAPAQ
eukprot:244924-Chlamydomonas_euryale.AAC.1